MMESLPEKSTAPIPWARRIRFLLWPPTEPELANAGRAGEVVIARARLFLFVLLILPNIATLVRDPRELSGWLGIATALICIAIGCLILRRARTGPMPRSLQVFSVVLDVSLASAYHALLFVAGDVAQALESRATFAIYLIAIVGAALRYDGRLVRLAGLVATLQYLGIVQWAHATGRVNAVANNFYGDSSLAGQGEEVCVLFLATVLGSILVERARELRLSGIRDPLTKLANRSYFAERLESEFAERAATMGNKAVAMLDIDHFKDVNDTYGHHAGDAVIRLVAAQLRRALRPNDLAARLGGEEFALYFSETAPEAAWDRLQTLRTAVENSIVPWNGRAIAVTVSIGIAVAPVDGHTPERLLAVADARLLDGKRAGRNRVVAKTASQI